MQMSPYQLKRNCYSETFLHYIQIILLQKSNLCYSHEAFYCQSKNLIKFKIFQGEKRNLQHTFSLTLITLPWRYIFTYTLNVALCASLIRNPSNEIYFGITYIYLSGYRTIEFKKINFHDLKSTFYMLRTKTLSETHKSYIFFKNDNQFLENRCCILG